MRGLARTTEGTERDAGSGDSYYRVPFATCRFIRGRLFRCFSFGCFVHFFGLCLFRLSFRSFGSSAVHALLTFALRDRGAGRWFLPPPICDFLHLGGGGKSLRTQFSLYRLLSLCVLRQTRTVHYQEVFRVGVLPGHAIASPSINRDGSLFRGSLPRVSPVAFCGPAAGLFSYPA
jgi:hypothetical protein